MKDGVESRACHEVLPRIRLLEVDIAVGPPEMDLLRVGTGNDAVPPEEGGVYRGLVRQVEGVECSVGKPQEPPDLSNEQIVAIPIPRGGI